MDQSEHVVESNAYTEAETKHPTRHTHSYNVFMLLFTFRTLIMQNHANQKARGHDGKNKLHYYKCLL